MNTSLIISIIILAIIICAGLWFFRGKLFNKNKVDAKKSGDAEAYFTMGNEYRKKGNYDKAIECLEKAVEINPNLAKAYSNMELVYEALGNQDKATECFQKAKMIRNNK